MLSTHIIYELSKEAGVKTKALGWLADLSKKAPRLTGIGNFSKGIKPTTSKLYKGIAVKKSPLGVREITQAQFTKGAPTEKLFRPTDILKRTIGAGKDMAAPFKGSASIGQKLKNAVGDLYHSIKYKPGEMFQKGGKYYQNVHERTFLGKLGYGTQLTLPGAAAMSYAANKDMTTGKRTARAVAEGVAWSPVGLPIAGAAFTGKLGYDAIKWGIKSRQAKKATIPSIHKNINSYS
jgi:hypothetical protein